MVDHFTKEERGLKIIETTFHHGRLQYHSNDDAAKVVATTLHERRATTTTIATINGRKGHRAKKAKPRAINKLTGESRLLNALRLSRQSSDFSRITAINSARETWPQPRIVLESSEGDA